VYSRRSIARYERFATGYERLLENALNHKSVVIIGVTILFIVSLAMYPRLGTELFPETDAGTFTIQFSRARRYPYREDDRDGASNRGHQFVR